MRKIGKDTKYIATKQKRTLVITYGHKISPWIGKKCLLNKNVQNLPLSKTLGCLITLKYHEINIPLNVQP